MPSTSIDTIRTQSATALVIAVIAAVFSVALSVVMLLNLLQMKRMDPLQSKALTALEERLVKTPADDQLREDVRTLDLISRKAFFTSQHQLKFGAYLLLAGVVVMLVALKTNATLNKRLPEPQAGRCIGTDWVAVGKARFAAAIAGGALVTFALGSAFISHGELALVVPSGGGGGGDGVAAVEPPGTGGPAAEPADTEPVTPDQVWPYFRGPQGIAAVGDRKAPVRWNRESGDGICWTVPTPQSGHSSPIVYGSKLFMTGVTKKQSKTETTPEIPWSLDLHCLDVKTGKILWQTKPGDIPFQEIEDIAEDEIYAAPTPATDGQRVFAVFATGHLVCYSLEGKKLWEKSLELPSISYGYTASPIVVNNRLFIQYDDDTKAKVIALNAETGELLWSIPRNGQTWSSPIHVNTGQRDELVLAGHETADAYDPASGKKLWSLKCLGGEVCPSPAFSEGVVYVANEYAMGTGIQVGEAAGETGARKLWQWDDSLPCTASPVAAASLLFLATADGLITCVDGKKGETAWEHEFKEGYSASPIVIGDQLYVLDETGVMHIIKVAPTFTAVGDPTLAGFKPDKAREAEKFYATPAFAHGRIYVRGTANLYCIGE